LPDSRRAPGNRSRFAYSGQPYGPHIGSCFLENFAKRQVIANVPRAFNQAAKLAKGDARRWPARDRRPLDYKARTIAVPFSMVMAPVGRLHQCLLRSVERSASPVHADRIGPRFRQRLTSCIIDGGRLSAARLAAGSLFHRRVDSRDEWRREAAPLVDPNEVNELDRAAQEVVLEQLSVAALGRSPRRGIGHVVLSQSGVHFRAPSSKICACT
jgi:hypothetical protein